MRTGLAYFLTNNGENQAWLLPFPPGSGTPKRILGGDIGTSISFSWFPDNRHIAANTGAGDRRFLLLLDTEGTGQADYRRHGQPHVPHPFSRWPTDAVPAIHERLPDCGRIAERRFPAYVGPLAIEDRNAAVGPKGRTLRIRHFLARRSRDLAAGKRWRRTPGTDSVPRSRWFERLLSGTAMNFRRLPRRAPVLLSIQGSLSSMLTIGPL